ncbi:MAG TPA: hypothetical protein VFT74_05115 [Isosphaeraceae bacterium]|nr:hypothetical protein [Isosphaeraceae bacterium]
MLECCILFVHYRDDPTTRAHLDLMRRLNPYPVVAVCNAAPEYVDGALDVARLTSEWSGEHPWGGADTILYRWFLHGGLRAERYVFLEWDTLATMPVREFYDEVWDADAAGAVAKRIERDPDWFWFHQIGLLPEALRPHAGGLLPLNGTLLSHRALAAITASPIPPNIFCELRLGTVLRACGFTLTELPEPKRRMNSYDSRLITFDANRPGIYHPIKGRILPAPVSPK